LAILLDIIDCDITILILHENLRERRKWQKVTERQRRKRKRQV
jgi:hypothetical protein